LSCNFLAEWPVGDETEVDHGDEERARSGEADVSGVLEHPDRAGDTAMQAPSVPRMLRWVHGNG